MVDKSLMQPFDSQLKQQNAEWNTQMSLRKKIAWHSQGCGSHACHVLQWNGLVLDHPITISMTVNGRYYCTSLQNMLRPTLHHKQPNCLSMVSLSAWQCNISSPLWCATAGATLGLGDIGTSPLLSRSRPMWLLVVCLCERTSSG